MQNGAPRSNGSPPRGEGPQILSREIHMLPTSLLYYMRHFIRGKLITKHLTNFTKILDTSVKMMDIQFKYAYTVLWIWINYLPLGELENRCITFYTPNTAVRSPLQLPRLIKKCNCGFHIRTYKRFTWIITIVRTVHAQYGRDGLVSSSHIDSLHTHDSCKVLSAILA